jgi:hypothetical protein
MPNNNFTHDTYLNRLTQQDSDKWDAKTARWTSSTYDVKFASVTYVDVQPEDEYSFDLSAYGISRLLRRLLGSYSDRDLHRAAEWVTTHQNHVVADILQDMAIAAHQSGETIPELQDLFIATETELYLPYGMKMPICCVTNIVPRDTPDDGMDKFVALLEPSEAESYVNERIAFVNNNFSLRIH